MLPDATATHRALLNHSPAGRRFATLVAVLLAAACVLPGCGQPKSKPLSGKLTVLVRPPDRKVEPVAVDAPGAALPVQSGGAMVLDGHLDEPGFIYLVWLDSEGNVLPLYPWNNESLEVKDINQPPPVRRAGKLVFSPLLGRDWTFGNQAGTETVLLLARRTPLPAEIQLGSMITMPPQNRDAVTKENADETTKSATAVKIIGRATEVTVIEDGKATTDKTAPAPLLSLLDPLRNHFEFIHAIQFSHR